jgi:hypothetical protein
MLCKEKNNYYWVFGFLFISGSNNNTTAKKGTWHKKYDSNRKQTNKLINYMHSSLCMVRVHKNLTRSSLPFSRSNNNTTAKKGTWHKNTTVNRKQTNKLINYALQACAWCGSTRIWQEAACPFPGGVPTPHTTVPIPLLRHELTHADTGSVGPIHLCNTSGCTTGAEQRAVWGPCHLHGMYILCTLKEKIEKIKDEWYIVTLIHSFKKILLAVKLLMPLFDPSHGGGELFDSVFSKAGRSFENAVTRISVTV